MQLAKPKLKKLVIPEAIGAGYKRPSYEIEYSLQLGRDTKGKTIIDVSRDAARKILSAGGYRLPTAAELQVLGELGYKDPAFDDYFARNKEKTHYWEWTDTGLLKKDSNIRVVTEAGKEVGELIIPKDGVASEWSPFGIPSITTEKHRDGPETHFWFSANLGEIALYRGRSWSGARSGCSYLCADWEPGRSDSNLGLRPVRGSLPKYEKLKTRDYDNGFADGYKKALDEFQKSLETARQKFK